MKRDSGKKKILVQMRVTPIVQIACEKAGISRATYYRWRNEDKEFAKEADKSLLDGSLLINDLAESQLISAIRDKNIHAIRMWLQNHHPMYTNTLQITHALQDEELSPEQEILVRRALDLAIRDHSKIKNLITNNHEQQKHDTTRTDRSDDKRQESTGSNH